MGLFVNDGGCACEVLVKAHACLVEWFCAGKLTKFDHYDWMLLHDDRSCSAILLKQLSD